MLARLWLNTQKACYSSQH